MNQPHKPFTIRLPTESYETLVMLARLRHMTISDLTRQLVSEGLQYLLDPDEIDRMIEIEKQRLLEIARSINTTQEH